MTDIIKRTIEQLERVSRCLSAIGETEDYTDIAIQALEQTRWIPVSESLPKDGQKVLVTTRSGKFIDVDTCIFYHASAFWKHYVIAWMPLPQPYKAECEDKE